MKPDASDELRQLLELLAGQKAPFDVALPETALRVLDQGGTGLGHS